MTVDPRRGIVHLGVASFGCRWVLVTVQHKCKQGGDGDCGLPWLNSVAKRCELLVGREVSGKPGNPTGGESHEPLDEGRRRSRAGLGAQKRRRRRSAASDPLPSGHSFGVSSPASKSCPISVHRLSGSSVRG